jgi:integrase
MKITRKLIDALEPSGTDLFIWDDTMPGFGVRVQPSGRKVYILRYRTAGGTQRKMNIATCAVMMLDQAREKARSILVDVANGKDPAKDRQDGRTTATMTDLSRMHTDDRRGHVKPSSAANYDIMWRCHILPKIGRKRVADITDDDMAILHTDLGRVSHVNANRCLTLLHAAMKLAERKRLRGRHTNPTLDIQKFKEFPRQHILTPEERQRLFKALDEYTHPIWSVPWLVRLLLITGMRREEWAMAKWSWIDFSAGTISLPDSKTGPKVVHLADQTIAMLQLLRACNSSEWVCPNLYGTNGLQSFVKQWDWIRARAGLPRLRLHDLRHTVGSVGHQSGLSQREVADLLGHANMRTTERYISAFDAGRRESATRAAAAILQAVNR